MLSNCTVVVAIHMYAQNTQVDKAVLTDIVLILPLSNVTKKSWCFFSIPNQISFRHEKYLAVFMRT